MSIFGIKLIQLRHNKSLRLQNKNKQVLNCDLKFKPYREELKKISQNLLFTEKVKFDRVFRIQNDKSPVQYKKQKSSLTFNQQSKSNMISNCINLNTKTNEKLNLKKNNAISSKLSFYEPQTKFIDFQNNEVKDQEFTHDQRQCLKNAFRYICRLVFKQAHKYSERILKIEQEDQKEQTVGNQQKTIKRSKKMQKHQINQPSTDFNLFQQAQLISGERYFKQYLEKLELKQKKVLLKYMIWFLKCKYLRYINKCNNENKGKRKQMKKQLYIKFKNLIMLPYLEDSLNAIEA